MAKHAFETRRQQYGARRWLNHKATHVSRRCLGEEPTVPEALMVVSRGTEGQLAGRSHGVVHACSWLNQTVPPNPKQDCRCPASGRWFLQWYLGRYL